MAADAECPELTSRAGQSVEPKWQTKYHANVNIEQACGQALEIDFIEMPIDRRTEDWSSLYLECERWTVAEIDFSFLLDCGRGGVAVRSGPVRADN